MLDEILKFFFNLGDIHKVYSNCYKRMQFGVKVSSIIRKMLGRGAEDF